MGMYDRDWYREERRQARKAAQQQPQKPQAYLAPKKSRLGFLFTCLAVACAGYLLQKIF